MSILKNKKKPFFVCNSVNPDLVTYFTNEINYFKNKEIGILINRNIKHLINKKFLISSSTKKSFADYHIISDFFRTFQIFNNIKNEVSIIHFTTANFTNLFLGFLLKFKKTYQIYTIHDLKPHPGIKSIFIKLYNLLIFSFFADEVLVHSKGSEKILKKSYSNFKTTYIPLSGFKQHITQPKFGEYYLYFGRIDKYKGLNNLYKIALKTPKIKYVIAGKGYDHNIENLKSLENVTVINRFILENEIYDLFYNAKATIIPYTSATQSGVILLSYSLATPVISFNVGFLNEYIINNENGWLCESIYEMEDIILKLGKDDIINASKNTIVKYSNEYTSKAVEKKYLNLINISYL